MPQVIGGVRLISPSTEADCGCTFCGLFRAHHYWWRAVGATVIAVGLVLVAVLVDHEAARTPTYGGTAAVGGLMIAATGAVVLALGSWRLPTRRLLHRIRRRDDRVMG